MKRVRIVAAAFVVATMMGAPAASAFEGFGGGDAIADMKFKQPNTIPPPKPGFEWVYVIDIPAVCDVRGPFTNPETGQTEYTQECTGEVGHYELRRRR